MANRRGVSSGGFLFGAANYPTGANDYFINFVDPQFASLYAWRSVGSAA